MDEQVALAHQRVDRGVGMRAPFRQLRLRPLAELVGRMLGLASRRRCDRKRAVLLAALVVSLVATLAAALLTALVAATSAFHT